MKAPPLLLWIGVWLVALAACDPLPAPGCVWPTAGSPRPTAPSPSSCGPAGCASALPTCSPLPLGHAAAPPTLSLGCDLSFQNRTVKQLTWTDEDEHLADVALGADGENAVLYLRGGHLILAQVDRESWTVDLGPAQAAHLAMGRGQLALAWQAADGRWRVNLAADVYALADGAPALRSSAVSFPPDLDGAPAVMAFGSEGWLHLIGAEGEWRFDPSARQWEHLGAWPGATGFPIQLALTDDGTLLLVTDRALFRRAPDNGQWQAALSARELLAGSPGATNIGLGGLAVSGSRVALAWLAQFNDGVGEWIAQESADAGATWQTRGRYAVRCAHDSCGQVFAGFGPDGALTVTGLYRGRYGSEQQAPAEGKSDLVQAYWSQGLQNWCPDPGGQAAFASILNTVVAQPLGRVLAVSQGGQNVVVFEMRQFTGRNDLYGLRY